MREATHSQILINIPPELDPVIMALLIQGIYGQDLSSIDWRRQLQKVRGILISKIRCYDSEFSSDDFS